MALNITTGTATNIGLARAVRISVNAGLTGSITVTAAGSAQYGTSAQTIGTVTNPTVGQQLAYGGLHGQGQITVTPSGVCDLTVYKVSRIS